jgi:hypothetical protein
VGTGIHVMIEYEMEIRGNFVWQDFSNPYLQRDYGMFSLMAKVRGSNENSFNPRGFPEDASIGSRHSYYFFIIDDNEIEHLQSGLISKETAKKFIEMGSVDVGDRLISNIDYHSASWLTTGEFEKCIDMHRDLHYSIHVNYLAVLASMKEFEKHGSNCRLVFWFDN